MSYPEGAGRLKPSTDKVYPQKNKVTEFMIFKRQDIVWLILVLACFYPLLRYQTEAGQQAEPPQSWPGHLTPGHRHTLLLFVHPGCPCTRASLRQLERLTAKDWPGLKVYAVFSTPVGAESNFHKTGLWRLAERIPRVTAHLDRDGVLSREFGCYTSGQVLLYDWEGRLRFTGGLTDSRGHEGDSVGVEAIKRHLKEQTGLPNSEVYGCPLFSKADLFCHP